MATAKTAAKNPNNPVILITGAGKGIGRAIAIEFARRASEKFSPRLVLISRTERDLISVAREALKHDVGSIIFAGDISNVKTIEDLTKMCEKEFGRIDVLVNNAGVGRFGDFGKFSEEDFDTVMTTNLRGTFFLTQSVFNLMKKKSGGDIVFVTSTAAEKPYEQSAIYCMSKFAQKGLLEVIRLSARKNSIRVMNVMPGPVETPMWGEVSAKMSERMMQPQDVARIIVDAYFQPKRASVEEIQIRPISGDLQDDPTGG